MIDCSHGNSNKRWEDQHLVAESVAEQIAAGDDYIGAVMIESNIYPGNQKCDGHGALQYGVSITDACVGWDGTVEMLDTLANAVRQRRARN
jgi:3-deoxy-7-phosphoheptulonate synthase